MEPEAGLRLRSGSSFTVYPHLLESSTIMHQNVFRSQRALTLAAACLLGLSCFAARHLYAQPNPAPPPASVTAKKPGKIASEGVFTDKSSAKHAWQINNAHALLWEGAPYLPVGGAFTPRSFASADPAAWQNDMRALDTLQAKGVHDILIWPEKPLVDIPAPTAQRLLDYLDAKGFRYGVSFGPGLTQMASGNVVKPSVYRVDARPNVNADPLLTTEWITSNTDRGVVFLYDGASDSKIIREPLEVPVRDGVLSVPVETGAAVAHPYVLLLPHKTLPPQEQGTLPDVWNGFDSYRDRVLQFAGQIKWGAGLRFFLDPLARHLGLGGEASFLIPDSTAFRLEWESFLARKYASPEEARQKWALMDRFKSFSDLARLVPLWAYARGCPYFYDPLTRRFHRMLEGSASAANCLWWSDFQVCRDNGINYYMNTLAAVLKKQSADVPVVYTWSASSAFFTNFNRDSGFDGLAVTAHPSDSSRIARVFGPAYSQAEQSTHTTWFLTSEIDAPAPTSTAARVSTAALQEPPAQRPASDSYANKIVMARDFDDMRRIGSKGFFVKSLQRDGLSALSSSEGAGGDWLANPDSLTWLSGYADTLKSEGNAATLRPRVLFYPQIASGPAHIGLIPGTAGVYWLPGAFPGDSLDTQPTAIDLWPSYSGYNIQRAEGEPLSTVMTSLTGPRKTHFMVANPLMVHAYTAEGVPVPIKTITKNTIEVTIDAAPMILQFGSLLPPVPQEAAEDILLQLEALTELAKLQKVFGADNSRLALSQGKDYYVKRNYGQAYIMARNQLDTLINDALPYIWLEGEMDELPLFNEIAGHPEASQGAYRRLSTPNRPVPEYGYKARYKFIANHDGVYQVWLAGTIPGPATSPIKWRINNEPDRDIANPKPRGPLYMNDRFGWMLLGSVKLSKGEQKLVIDVTDPAAATHEYAFSIDAIMLTDKAFEPNTTIRPIPVDPASIREFKKDQRANSKDKTHYAP